MSSPSEQPRNPEADRRWPDASDPVVEAYKPGVDRTLLRENLRLSVEERFRKFERFMEYVEELREAGQRARSAR